MRELLKKMIEKKPSKPIKESKQLQFTFSVVNNMVNRFNTDIRGLLSPKGEEGRQKFVTERSKEGLKEYVKEALNTPKYTKVVQKLLASYGLPPMVEVYQCIDKDNPFDKDIFVASLSESFFLGQGKIGKILIPLQNIIGIGNVNKQEVIVKKDKGEEDEEEN